jgi:predicted Rossmann fold flavoprotein
VNNQANIVIVGGGAAGLMAAIWAGRTMSRETPHRNIVVLDGAKSLGAKILVAGGGRCNVTHDVVNEQAFAGSSRNAIRKVLRRFDVPQTVAFFGELGVDLKCEDTGKLFPVSDKARTVLEALLRGARVDGVELRHPWRVESVERTGDEGFRIRGPAGEMLAKSVIVATGGKSLPKTGSDGKGYEIVRGLSHSITPRVFPALVPLTMPRDHWACELSGVSAAVTLEVRSGTGKKPEEFTDSILLTHFGISGPVTLDISRHLTMARLDDPSAHLVVNWLRGQTHEEVDRSLVAGDSQQRSPGRWLREQGLSARLAEALCLQGGADASQPIRTMSREKRRLLVAAITHTQLPITGDRGFGHAEVTAGGVPLGELRLETMESRQCPGLYLCGEICDVDGRIGGYNFQWAWASGHVAGCAAARQFTNSESALPRD